MWHNKWLIEKESSAQATADGAKAANDQLGDLAKAIGGVIGMFFIVLRVFEKNWMRK